MPNPPKGRGALYNPHNRFEGEVHDLNSHYIDDIEEDSTTTEHIVVHPKTIVSRNSSPDVPSAFTINPYQGCEHGCTYCYARNSHEYWGYSMGRDFEEKILVKANAANLLRHELGKKSWKPAPIMLSGNTDCYQPAERKLQITRNLLEVLWQFKNPVGLITKNALITRDIDILQPMAEQRLASVALSINTLNEDLRRKLEPRTSSVANRLRAVKMLNKAGIHTTVMIAPVIPGLNSSEIPALIKRAKEAGAHNVSYILVRLNGQLGTLFENWLQHYFPDRCQKVLNLIKQTHAGKLNDSVFKHRMRGSGAYAEQINQLFKKSAAKYFEPWQPYSYNLTQFDATGGGQLKLF